MRFEERSFLTKKKKGVSMGFSFKEKKVWIPKIPWFLKKSLFPLETLHI